MTKKQIFEEQTFTQRPYTFTVEQLLAEQGSMVIKFLPDDVNLAAVTYNVPIWKSIDPDNLKEYLDAFAPFDVWDGQLAILSQGENILKKHGIKINTRSSYK